MRCLKEAFKENAVFHVYNHAIDNYQLFYDDIDYAYLLNIFEDNLPKIPCEIFAYCLMPDHYHFLIKQKSDKEIFKLFNYVFVRYAIYFNKKYDRNGPIFRSPLQHKLIENDIYLFQLSKYIHLNPVRKELVDSPDKWMYSNYIDWINKTDNGLTSHTIFESLHVNPLKYKEYVDSLSNYLSIKDLKELVA